MKLTNEQKLTRIRDYCVDFLEREKEVTNRPWSIPHYSRDDISCNCKYVLADGYCGAVCTIHHSEERGAEHGDNPPPSEAKANGTFIASSRTFAPCAAEMFIGIVDSLIQMSERPSITHYSQDLRDGFSIGGEFYREYLAGIKESIIARWEAHHGEITRQEEKV